MPGFTDCGTEAETAQQLKRNAEERLDPRLSDPNYLILRKRREIFERWLAGVAGDRLVVLDVGGRIQPYRPLIEARTLRYVAVDLRMTPLVDAVGEAEQLPFADASFDLVLCTQVLEYVADTRLAVAEMHRVLKPGGVLLLSTPAIFPRDSDEEYWRFQPAALRLLLAKFTSADVVCEGGSITGFVRLANVFLVMCAKFRILRTMASYSVVPMLNLAGRCLEALALSKNDQFAANYSAMARK